MEIYVLFVICGAILFLGFIGEYVFKKTNIPDVIWLMFFGILLGTGLDYVDPTALESVAPLFTTFALIFILFEGALHLDIRELFRSMYGAGILSVTSFLLSTGVVFLVCIAFGFGIMQSLLLGAAVAGTSSAVVLPIIRRIDLEKKVNTALTIESAISDVLCIVAVITILQIFEFGALELKELINSLLGTFLFAIFIGSVGALIWVVLSHRLSIIGKNYVVTVAFMLFIFGFTEYIGSNGAIACLAYGIVLGNSTKIFKKKHKLKQAEIKKIDSAELFFYSEISFVLKSFFFVYLGILLHFNSFMPYIIAGIIVFALYIIRPISSTLALKGIEPKDRAVVDSLIPKGLAAAVLAKMPIDAGVPGTESFADVVLGVILISILAGTVTVFMIEKGWFLGLGNFYAKLFSRNSKTIKK